MLKAAVRTKPECQRPAAEPFITLWTIGWHIYKIAALTPKQRCAAID
jgi:hypothetical protein